MIDCQSVCGIIFDEMTDGHKMTERSAGAGEEIESVIKFGKAVVKSRWVILIVSLALLVPSVLGMIGTRINYDILNYLPEDMDTVKGQNILLDDFGKGAFSMVMVKGMEEKDVSALKEKFESIDHVSSVIWYDSILDLSVPMELLPQKYYDMFNNGDTTMMAVFFDSATSADATIEAMQEMRKVAGEQAFISGMSAMVTDMKELCEKEEPIYVGIAVLLSCVVLAIFMDSILLPVLFMASIGMAILLNMGTNFFFGEISYITKALSAVLQLGVTMDYSIFLWHSYKEAKETMVGASREEAMAKAVANTITSVVGSSITTVAGFIALCFMTFTLGLDLGLVMAKGVVLGVLGCVTTLPSLILIFDKAITKTLHKPLIPNVSKLSRFIVGHGWIFLLIFALIIGPAFYGYQRTPVYYDFSVALPEDMPCVVANKMLSDEFDMGNMHMALIDANLDKKQVKEMSKEMENVDGVRFVLGLESELGSAMPDEMVQGKLTDELKGDNYQLMLISSEYGTATDEVDAQIDDLNAILKKYDSTGMLIGEAPCTKDLIEVTSHDFDVVNAISILSIFVIILLVTRSLSLPVLLLAGFKGPVYRLLKVEPNEVPSYVTMLCAAGACLHQGETLSQASEEKLETILSLEDWANGYSRFAGHDLYRDLEPSFMERAHLSLVEVFSIYLEALANYPDIVIKDRLDGMNLLWDVTQPDESFNTDYSDHAFIEPDVGLVMPGVEEGEAYRNPSLIARAYRWAAAFHFPGESLTGQLHNMLLWRSGAWLILLCVIMLYWIRRRLSDLWLCAAPLLGNLLAMALALCHQSFRYVYFVQPVTLCLLLLTVFFDARRRRAAAAQA
mgnify:CR=1 FL=1